MRQLYNVLFLLRPQLSVSKCGAQSIIEIQLKIDFFLDETNKLAQAGIAQPSDSIGGPVEN